MHLLPLLRTSRPAFLLITPVQVFLAWMAAIDAHRIVALQDVVLVLLAALAAHISVNALNEISFAVDSGRFFSLLGPNGAGQTPTISIITTTLSPT